MARIACILAALASFSVYEYQNHEVRDRFHDLRETSRSDEQFARAVTLEIQRMHRTHVAAPGERSDSPRYRLVHNILNGRGLCAHRSLLFVTAMREHGIRARKLLIGLDGVFITHVVAEAFVGGGWKVFDPLFGYFYERGDGELASASDLQAEPGLVLARVARDPAPYPTPYPVEKYHFHQHMLFNWWKLAPLRALREALGDAADEWEPPYYLNRPFFLSGVAFSLMALASVAAGRRNARRRRAGVPASWIGVDCSEPDARPTGSGKSRNLAVRP